MSSVGQKIRATENFAAIEPYLPHNRLNGQTTPAILKRMVPVLSDTPRVLDLGCGEGNSIDLFNSVFHSVDWHGVDIADSPEVRSRTRDDAAIKVFDGIHLPYADHYFDLIYTNQVLEHVRYPDQLMRDAYRVLKPGGWLIGAVSYLEPFHSYSVFNFTPYGVSSVLSESGFEVQEICAGADASQLINRQLLNRSPKLRWLWSRNYIHFVCRCIGRLCRLDNTELQFLKLQFAGHINFIACRPE